MRQRYSTIFFLAAILSWGLLLLSALSQTGELTALGEWPRWTTQVTQALFVLNTFLYYRYRGSDLQGMNFVGLLRRLLTGPGMLALLCIGLHLLEQTLNRTESAYDDIVFNTIYTINLGFFVVFLARTNYAWQSLVFFKTTPLIERAWVLFEVLLGGTLLFRLVGGTMPPSLDTLVLGVLALFGVFLSSNQKWVAYLSQQDKWRAVAIQAGLLLGLLIFVQYFRITQRDPQLVAPTPQYTFLLLTAFFAAFYSLMGLLVTLFNLPISAVIEQRRNEIVSLQRLTQIIQRGQTATEIYQTLLESTVATVQADAAWLEIAASPDASGLATDLVLRHRMSDQQIAALHRNSRLQELQSVDFINNNLTTSPDFDKQKLPFRSLIMLPLSGPQSNYGTLYLLKNQVQGFDHEDLGIIQTFTSQAVLSIENLKLVATSLQNQRTQDELKIASRVQDSLIPKNLPTDNWFDISSHSLAAKEVGGDFYDFLHLPGRRLAVLIGDVSGKGITAAFHMAQMKGIFHSLMQENPLAKNERDKFPLPSRFMTQANAALAHCLERSSFITSTLYIIDYEQGGFMFARAGHCHTLYYHALREEVFYFQSTGLGLGIIRNETYEKHISNQFYDYSPGDVMVIYTDGIVEARGTGNEEYGEERLLQRLQESYYLEAEEIKDFILADFNQFTHGYPVHDDQTLLVIKFKTAQPTAFA